MIRPLVTAAVFLAAGAVACSHAERPSATADLDTMPSSMPAPPPGSCREGPSEPRLCGFVSVTPLRDAFGARTPSQRGFGARDAERGDPPLRPLGEGPWVYEGLMTVPETGRYGVRVDGAREAALHFDDPRLVARHAPPAPSVELAAGVHWFWLVVEDPRPDLSVYLRRVEMMDRDAPVEQRVATDPRMAGVALTQP